MGKIEKNNKFKDSPVGIIPKDWNISTIGKSCNIKNTLRKPISADIRRNMKGPYPYYGPTGIVDYINEYRITGKFVLIGEDGDHFLKFDKKRMTHLVEGKFNVNNHAHIIQGSSICLTSWIHCYFQHRDIFSYLTRQGAGRYKLNKGTLLIIPIPLPPLPEQKKIVTILSAWDKAISHTEKLIEAKEKLKKGLMQQLFTQGLGHSEFQDSSVGQIPQEWDLVKTIDVASGNKYSCVGGPFGSNLVTKDYIESPGVPVTRGNNLTIGGCKFIDEGFVYVSENKAKTLLQNTAYPGDILFTQRGTIGQVGVIPCKANFSKYILSQNQMKLTPDFRKVNVLFLYYYFSSPVGQKIILINSIGTAIPGFNLTLLRSSPIPLPPLPEQKKIAAILSAADKEIHILQKKLAALQKQKKALMQQLLTGKTRVFPKGECHE